MSETDADKAVGTDERSGRGLDMLLPIVAGLVGAALLAGAFWFLKEEGGPSSSPASPATEEPVSVADELKRDIPPTSETPESTASGTPEALEPARETLEAEAATPAIDEIEPGPYIVQGSVHVAATGESTPGAEVHVWRSLPPLAQLQMGDTLRAARNSRRPAPEHSLDPENRGQGGQVESKPEPRWPRKASLSCRCDDQGHFELRGIPRQSFYLTARSDSLLSVATIPVHIEQGFLSSPIEIGLEPGGQVTGQVLREGGSAAVGASVTLGQKFNPMSAMGGGVLFRTPAKATTDEEGRYRFPAVPAQEAYTVSASLEGFASSDPIDVEVRSAATERVDIQLSSGGSLDVLVQGPQKQPLPGIAVRLQPTSFDFYAQSRPRLRIRRGGSFNNTASLARSANRSRAPPEHLSNSVGVRPARALD